MVAACSLWLWLYRAPPKKLPERVTISFAPVFITYEERPSMGVLCFTRSLKLSIIILDPEQ